MANVLISVSLLLLATGPAVAQSPSAPASSEPSSQLETVTGTASSVDKATQTEDVRFRTEVNDRMTVPVRLSGKGPYRFLVDTGADRTAISRDLASRLKLSAGENVELHSVAGASSVSTANVLGLQLTRKAVNISDAPLLESANMGADGILGTDSLASQRVVFDFAAQTMSVVPAATPDFRDEPGTIVVEARRRNGRTRGDGRLRQRRAHHGRAGYRLADQHRQRGAAEGTAEKLSIRLRASRTRVRYRREACRQLHVRTGDRAGSDRLKKNTAVVFAPAHTFKQLKLDNKPALLLGMNAMRAFKKVSIDFSRNTLRVIVPESSRLDVRLADARF